MTEPAHDPAQIHKCSICGHEYTGWGNNAEPINDGRCCNDCNDLVIARRLYDARGPRGPE